MSWESKALVTLCAIVAIYAVCAREWWVADSWAVTTLCALGMAQKVAENEEFQNEQQRDQ